MSEFETDLSDASKGGLLVLIAALLVPLLIWAFGDLERRKQSWREPRRGSVFNHRDS